MKDRFFEWLEANTTLYRGTNASDCMELAFMAGVAARDADLRKLRDDMSNSIGPIYNDKTRVWLKRIDELLDKG